MRLKTPLNWLNKTVVIVSWKKRDPEQIFQVLEGGLKGGKILNSFSVAQQTSYTTNSSCTILLWIELLRFIISLVVDWCRSSSWRVWIKKPHQFILTITTDHDITNMEGKCTKMYNQRWITGSFKMQICMNNVALYQNKNQQLCKTGSARGDAWLRRISANNLLPLENASSLLKTLLPRFPIVFGLP